MDKHRQIAFILAFIVALLIMMIGKACTDDMMKKQQAKPVNNETAQTTPAYNEYNNYIIDYNNYSYNNTPQTTAQQQTEIPVEYVTNMFGEVVGTSELPVQSATTGTYTQNNEIQQTTQERSILEEYNKDKVNITPKTDGNNNYTPPSEINITIN